MIKISLKPHLHDDGVLWSIHRPDADATIASRIQTGRQKSRSGHFGFRFHLFIVKP